MPTNYLDKIDPGIKDRCHLIEMNQAPIDIYVQKAIEILGSMGVKTNSINIQHLQNIASNAKGSVRKFTNDIFLEGLAMGGIPPN